MGRSLWAILSGALVATLWIIAIGWLDSLVFPWPDSVQMDDQQAIFKFLSENGNILVGTLVARLVGTFIGGWIGGRVARQNQTLHGFLVGLVTFSIGVLKAFSVPYPTWFLVVGQLTFLVGGTLGGLTASLIARTPAPANT
jgi:putative membrane protein (TIGR04086 family)